MGKEKRKKIRQSAGILMFDDAGPEGVRVLVVHPGGPLYTHRNEGFWSIPKGEFSDDEEAWSAALREFEEETGMRIEPPGQRISLGLVIQKGGKVVYAWAVRGSWEEGRIPVSNTFPMEWPPGSGVVIEVPEVDRAEMVPVSRARILLKAAQEPFLDRLCALIREGMV